jgi:hypothetical protein
LREGKESFVMYCDQWANCFSKLSVEERGELITAIFLYETEGEEPRLGGALDAGFSFIRSRLDSNAEKYRAKCEKNRAGGSASG